MVFFDRDFVSELELLFFTLSGYRKVMIVDHNHRKIPVIKGMFVNSHIRAVRKVKGEAGVKELERRPWSTFAVYSMSGCCILN